METVVIVVAESVWVLVLLVLAFRVSLAFTAFIILSKLSFAIVYPSSWPKFIHFATPSSNISSISLSKFCSSDFFPLS